jgi:hypothetical protein
VILPSKHLSISKCLLSSGATILEELKVPNTISSLWEKVRILPEITTFERFVFALTLLYSLDVIDLSDGLLRKKSK